MPGFDTGSVLFALNVDFSGNSLTSGTAQVTQDGQLLIGSSVAPNIRVAKLTAGSGIGIVNANGSITISNTAAASITIDGDTGSATGSTITFSGNPSNTGSSVSFAASGTTVDLKFTDSNNNIILGAGAGNTGITNTQNTAVGHQSLYTAGLAQGNTCIGAFTGYYLITGSQNTLLGYSAGFNYNNAESNNILIQHQGVATESNVMRLGATGSGPNEVSKAFIAGINGVSVSNPLIVAMNSSTEQFGTLSFVPLSLGGTNANLTASNGGIFYSTASAGAILSGTATAGQILQSGASSAPSWSTATYPATAGTSGNVLTSNGTNWISSPASGGGSITNGSSFATVTLSNAVPKTITSVSLAAGTYMITGQIYFSGQATETTASISTTNNTLGALGYGRDTFDGTAATYYEMGTATVIVIATYASTTTVYLVGQMAGSGDSGTGTLNYIKLA